MAVPEIQTDDLKSWLNDKKGQFVLIDTLPAASFNWEHLPGAVNVDFHSEGFLDLIKQAVPSPSSEIVVYCSDYYCPTSGQAAKMLVGSGYQHVFKYRRGLAGWLEDGNQTEKGINWESS